MSDKRQQMQGFLSRANAVMNRVEQIAPIVPSKGQPTLSESLRLEGVGGMDYGYDDNQQPQQYQPQGVGGFSPAAKNLPSSIMESIQQNPIQEYQGQMGGLSVLDGIIPQQPPRQQYQPPRQQYQPPRQQINEDYYGEKPMPNTEDLFRSRTINTQQYRAPEYQAPAPVYQPQTSGGIDYGVISSLIKTAIAEEMVKLRKTLLTEGKNGSGDVIIKADNGIKFITNNGNVYEGKLKLVGNLKN
jgi:hypothetical protein